MMPCSGEAGGMLARRLELALGLAARLVGQAGLLDPPAQVGAARRLVLLAELALDRPELLAQEVLALRLRHPLRRLGRDLLAQLAHRELVLQQIDQPAQLGVDRIQLEELLAVLRGERRGGGDEVGDLAADPRAPRPPSRAPRACRPTGSRASGTGRGRRGAGLGLVRSRDLVRRDLDAGHEIRLGRDEVDDADPLEPLEHDA